MSHPEPVAVPAMTEAQAQALRYLAAVCGDYANTLPASVRGPFIRECQEAIKAFEEPKA